jgi:hypothetical protein
LAQWKSIMRKCRSDYDPLNKFIRTTWGNLNRRTINGARPDRNTRGSRRYIDLGIRLEFTREEFVAWCRSRRELILGMQQPSIDRIDPASHYELANMRIIPRAENAAQGRLANHLKAVARRPVKHCLMCGSEFQIRRKEGAAVFARRKTCGVTCLGKAMSAGLIFRGRAAIKQRRQQHGPTTTEVRRKTSR